jgi:hypothetical protein
MKKKIFLIIVLGVMLSLASFSIAMGKNNNYVAHLTGGQEVPPNGSRAQGQAIFRLSADGQELYYKIIVANIDNVVASHIHLGQPGVSGGIVLPLIVGIAPGGGRTDGVLVEGTATAANLTGVLAGHPLSDLIAQIEAGNAYVNVHTNDGVAPTNTGPGDIATGEIRGQIH